MIPRRLLAGNPDRLQPRLSPDGARISYLAPLDGALNLFVAPAANLGAARPVTEDRGRGIRTYEWAFTSRDLLYLQDRDGDEDWHVYRVDLEASDALDLTPFEGVAARIEARSHRHPDQVVLGVNGRDPQLHDAYRVDLRTGRHQLLLENPGFLEIGFDLDFTPRYAVKLERTAHGALLVPDGAGGWCELGRLEPDDAVNTQIVGLDAAGRRLYLIDTRDRDVSALTCIDLQTGGLEVLFEGARADLEAVLRHPTERTPQAVAHTYERIHWEALDPDVAPDLEALGAVSRGDLGVASRTLDDETWLVAHTVDDGPVRYHRYDRASRRASFLFSERSELEDVALARMQPHVIRSRDGLDLVCYLTLPRDAEPGAPLPMILWVHGGPWARDRWGFAPIPLLFADRGCASLLVNFRGSTGFGKRFIAASAREWGGRMHDDLIDAVEWAVREGVADRERIAIAGGSYGGYAALVGLTFTPEVFACGVDAFGPSSLLTLIRDLPPYWMPSIGRFTLLMGNPDTEEGRALLEERSPLNHVERICRPLLIVQGANDPRVRRGESDRIVEAMRSRGIPVTYLLYPDEGHGLARPENNLAFLAVAEAFLARRLGVQAEPFGDVLRDSSVQVLEGVDHVPGLAEALE